MKHYVSQSGCTDTVLQIINQLKYCLDCLEALQREQTNERSRQMALAVTYLSNIICYLGYFVND